MREAATRRRAEPLQLLAETHHAQSLEMNGSPEKRAGSGPQQLGADASAAERAFRSGRQYPAAVYADVEMWLDRELFEALDEAREELSERSISRPFDEHRTGSVETNLARTWPIRPYPDLNELHHEKTERLSKAASAANIPTIDSQAAMKGLTRTKIEALRSDEIEPQRAATKRRRATVSVLSCDELNIYLKAALDELEREIDSAEVGESYVEDAPPRSRTPSIPTKKASRRVASLEQEENARVIAHSQTDTIGQALHRIYAELRQRVLAHKYETVEAFVADLSLLLSDLSRSKTDHASTRTGIRQRTDLIRQRVDALLQPAEITRVLRTRPGAPGVSSPPMETMPFPTKAFRDPLTTYWQWLQEQLTLDFGSREALGAALISYSSEGGNSEQDTFPELSRAALMPDLRGAVRSPLGSVSSYNGMLALNGHVSEPLVLPNGYRDQVRRIWRLREQRRFLDGMTTWITQQRVVSNTTSKGATILAHESSQLDGPECPEQMILCNHDSDVDQAERKHSEAPLKQTTTDRVMMPGQLHGAAALVSNESQVPAGEWRTTTRSMPLFIETDPGPENTPVAAIDVDDMMAETSGSAHPGVERGTLTHSLDQVCVSASSELINRPRSRQAGLFDAGAPLSMHELQRAVAAVLVVSGFTNVHRSALEALTEIVAELVGRLGRQLAWLRYQTDPMTASEHRAPLFKTPSAATNDLTRQNVFDRERVQWQPPRDYVHRSRCDLLRVSSFDPLRYLAETIGRCGIRDGFNGLVHYGRTELPAMEQLLTHSEALMAIKLAETERALAYLKTQHPGLEPPVLHDEHRSERPPTMQSGAAPVDIDPETNAVFRLFGIVNDYVTLDVLQLEKHDIDTVAMPYSLARRIASQLEEDESASLHTFKPRIKVAVSTPALTRRRR